MTKSDSKKEKQSELLTANATIIGKDPCLYPLALPGENGATMQKCQNLLFLQNYIASQQLLQNNNIARGFGGKKEMRIATSKATSEPNTEGMKEELTCEKEDDAKKQQHKKKAKKKKRPPQLNETKKENTSRNKRQKTSGDQAGKKLNTRPKKGPRSPMAVTPRPKASSDSMGFVSMSLPVPRDITAEWQNFKKEIITPPWQTKRYQDDDHHDGESSSEEDISEEAYFKWHTRSFERDCQRIRKVLENNTQKKKLKPARKPGSRAKSKTNKPPKKQLLSQPTTYNYDVFAPEWSKPVRYIRFVDANAERKVAAKTEADAQTKIPKVERGANAGKPRRKKRRGPPKEDLKLRLRTPSNEEDLAEMKLRYLELQAQLEKLCGKKRDSSVEKASRSTWKAEKKTGKDGKETNVIRLLRVSKLAA
uniref:Uncharacterized protein n=1 Tax=Lotharella oceanica TaxID=641309 RepID=A0A7S2XAS9_9EUKA|mmetsp:Transcript_25603/g.47746  ORF Transcript_25603/g.47746 Transcript_25603/m.47746 type:complete len:421 (+) Transcript_25603:128-1390(+)